LPHVIREREQGAHSAAELARVALARPDVQRGAQRDDDRVAYYTTTVKRIENHRESARLRTEGVARRAVAPGGRVQLAWIRCYV